ncbi:MAG: ABC transporter permease [Deltaproteobacteria bacterium]|nr:MAG: ABC transporter permease [Deltaproteobacteria bacterium]
MSLDTWQEILATLRGNVLRTLLTALGVFWGIFMLVVMLGAGRGLERGVTRGMAGFATNSIFVWGQRTSLPYDGLPPGRFVAFENADIDLLRDKVDGIEYLAPRLQLGGWRGGDNVTRGAKTGNFNVNGDYPELQYVQGMDFIRGRFINQLDIDQRRKVAVIGPRVYETLYQPGEDPIGTHIKIKGVYFTVVGHFKPKGTGGWSERLAATIFVPFTTFQSAFNQGNRVGWFAITVPPGYDIEKVERDIKRVLAKRHRIHPDDRQAFGSFNAGKSFREMSAVFIGINALVWFVGICTLLAGVIGVSNIMLIVVKERTKEIGIKKALGATPWAITSQIVQESTILTAIAGYLGLSAGVVVLAVIDKLDVDILASPQVDLRIALIATAILVIAGAFAGLIPAYHAVRIHPVAALRSE